MRLIWRTSFSSIHASSPESNAPVLEIGCGSGGICRFFAGLGANVTGIEYDVGRVMTLAAQNPPFRLIGGDGHHLPFEARSFDFIILADVLEHVADPARMMREAARVARSGGLVFVGATNRASIANLLFDPHYNAPLIPLMSKRVAAWYVTRLLRLSDTYHVEKYFFRGQLVNCIRGAGFSCEALPIYRDKIRAGEFAAAPGRTLFRRALKLPGAHQLMAWSADTAVFEYCIAPGFNFLGQRQSIDGAEGIGRLVCPACRGGLSQSAERYECSGCGRSFEVRQGVPLMHLADAISNQGVIGGRNSRAETNSRPRLRTPSMIAGSAATVVA